MSLYVYVYVDDDPIPVISDYHLSGEQTPYTCALTGAPLLSRIWMGHLGFPFTGRKAHLALAYVRWSPYPTAPYQAPQVGAIEPLAAQRAR
jgi:hypothetical protein